MRNFTVSTLVTALLVLAVAAAAEEKLIGREPVFNLDHFKVYLTETHGAGFWVELRGQFDGGFKGARLITLQSFANPVSKNGEGIRNPNAHLTWYLMDQTAREPHRTVTVINQFGEQELALDFPKYLLVPAQKRGEQSVFPRGLDHYKCYVVEDGPPVEREVTLEDQFLKEEVFVDQARFFCVPVAKYHRGRISEINNSRDHLTFYGINGRDYKGPRWFTDQFGTRQLQPIRSTLLGVPSLKQWESEKKCVDFESLPLGASYHVGDTFTESGAVIEARDFQWSNGVWTSGGHAGITNYGQAGGSGQEAAVNNINLSFDFGGPLAGLSLRFGEYGGNLNLAVNGDHRNFDDFATIHGAVIGGVNVSVVSGSGAGHGSLTLSGAIERFVVGGQEFAIDDVCPER